MAGELGTTLNEIMGKGADNILKIKDKWVSLIGEFTFNDIYEELKKPGRDPRAEFQPFQFRDDIFELKDVKPGMICNGIVTNVTNFGAFVDIGVHQDGLVHISELSNQFVNDAQKVVSPGSAVSVKVKSVDLEKNQISLTMKLTEAVEAKPRREQADQKPREDRPRGDRKDAPRGGGRPHDKSAKGGNDGGKSGGQKSSGGNNNQDRDRKPRGQPFNNPFAALQDIRKN
jgi:uncharacterized protein